MKLIKPSLTWEEKQIATELLKIADKSVHPKELSTLSNQQKEGVAILAKKEYVTLAGKWVIIWWDDLTSALNPGQNTYPECFECSISLKGRPCVFVDSLPYCFKCAKQYEREIIESAKYKYEKELKLYQEKRSAFLKNHPNDLTPKRWT